MKLLFLRFVLSLLIFATMSACSQMPTPQAALTPPAAEDTPAPETPSQTSAAPAETSPNAAAPTHTSSPPLPSPTPSPAVPLPIPQPLMGVEPHHPEQETVLSLLSESGAQIIRFNAALWNRVEPQEGQYNWAALQNLDIALQELAARNIEVILIVRGTPEWAQKVPGSSCGPVAQDKLGTFASFISELVRRYSAPPYKVKYWELGNEPDVDPALVSPNSIFGCWGNAQDALYGGGYYAEMLKVVYPVIKAANPEAQVLIGGLLLDCDPENPPEGKDCQPARFFEGILANGGADFFDVVSFHGYPPFVNQSLAMDWNFPNWKARGGVVVGKINYLRSLMQQYGVDKPLFLTESSLICPESNTAECAPPGERFFQAQADYVVRLYVRNWALGIAGTIWYDFEGQGWRYGSLVGPDPGQPKPAFRAFQYMNEKLAGMVYTGRAPFPEGVEGYAFESGDRRTWVAWSRDESPLTVELPPDVLVVYDKYGQEIPLSGMQITITTPIYIDLAP